MNVIEKNFRFRAGNLIGNSKLLFPLNAYRAAYKKKIVGADSDCCIEGFQRSGSSFFVLLFNRANKSVKLAHHTHASAQVIRAVNYKVPTIVLIRKPEDVIASLLAWDSKLKINLALGAYINFHQKILAYKVGYMLVDFEDVTESPAKVVTALNSRFGTDFKFPKFSEDKLNLIKQNINLRNEVFMSPLPTPEKESAKELFRLEIERSPKLLKANKLYEQFYKHRHLF